MMGIGGPGDRLRIRLIYRHKFRRSVRSALLVGNAGAFLLGFYRMMGGILREGSLLRRTHENALLSPHYGRAPATTIR